MEHRAPLVTPVLLAGCVIILVSFAIRSAFGVFQIPIQEEFGWLRAEFSLAIAIQNLAWGIGAPLFGAIAERFTDRKAIMLGIALYTVGLLLSAVATTPMQHNLLEMLVGFGIAGTGMGLILAIVGRASSDENRSMALAIATAAASGGQIFGPPVAEALLSIVSLQAVFVIFALAVLSTLLVLPALKARPGATPTLSESMGPAVARALKDPNFTLIFLGFFSCGYQLGFITAHFPAFVTELCGPISPGGMLAGLGITTNSALGAIAISLIGVANIAGVLAAGWAGKRYRKKSLLAGIYLARTLVAAAFIMVPITPETVILFSLGMGALWLATVPLTSGLVAHLYGVRYMGTLYGVVFLSHQIGSFTGVWLGGRLHDLYGDYTLVWWVGVGVGLFSALVHLPIKERPASPLPA
ncbi:transmembrane transporter [Dinoroseobacter shibae DFL 12 = DSM 16493]|jgi:MFS family permease|uniref:Transmembrane transporter n=1 Tax=Dinoroseobacter shibae (strain DSM 16493 / NCIMB 14021 / DFL 12) TaxID=398580 RepID=A8LKL7_DINSH|nr:MFS transporter [Dinoroseobacter shibae]ABV91860.1 transmembrane transporter [Dinoroseobacter shibae DFL 12 = DSM 16493]URF46838.1 MFS transporter [Dinoroseobacter shibae]URF51149.1 MFS transporter [Dinoroseobacter shibae]